MGQMEEILAAGAQINNLNDLWPCSGTWSGCSKGTPREGLGCPDLYIVKQGEEDLGSHFL